MIRINKIVPDSCNIDSREPRRFSRVIGLIRTAQCALKTPASISAIGQWSVLHTLRVESHDERSTCKA